MNCAVPASLGTGFQSVLFDDFNGSSLNTAVWSADTSTRRNATNTSAAVSVGNGALTITTSTLNGKHSTGFLSSTGYTFDYGYVEARINFADSPGEWSAFWLYRDSVDRVIGDPNVSGTEPDIAEHRRVDSNGRDVSSVIVSNNHWDGYGPDAQSTGSGEIASTGTSFQGNYHTYGLYWTPTQYQFFVDGNPTWATQTAVSHVKQFMRLTSEVENGWAGNTLAGGYGSPVASQTKMTVDYVAVYQRFPTLNDIADQELNADTVASVPVTVNNPGNLAYTLTATSSNQALLPDGNLSFNGNTLRLTPAPLQTGSATVTVTAKTSDGRDAGYATFVARVNAGTTVLNGTFESGLTGWTATGAPLVATDYPRSGQKALKVNATGSGVTRTVTGLKPNTTYVYTGWGSSFRGGSVVLGVKGFGGTEVQTTITNQRYSQGTVTFITGANSTSATLYARADTSGLDAYLDDLSLARAVPLVGDPVLKNGGFESDTQGWGVVYGDWNVVTSGQRLGARAFKTTTAARDGGAEQVVNLLPNTTYVFRGWAHVSGPGQTAYFGVKEVSGGAILWQLTAQSTSTAYTQGELRFTTRGLKAGETSVPITIWAWAPRGGGDNYYDDFGLWRETPLTYAGSFGNGNFEQDPRGIGWALSGSAAVVDLAGDQRSGKRALQFTSAGSATLTVTGLAPNTTYTLGGWGRVANARWGLTLTVQAFNGNAKQSVSFSSSAYAAGTITFTTGPTATQATMVIATTAPVAAAPAYVDDLFLYPA